MTQTRIAYLPLVTYPDIVADGEIQAAVQFAAGLDCALHLSTFAVEIPPVSSPLGGILLDIPGLVRAAEDRSRAEALRIQGLVQSAAGDRLKVHAVSHEVVLGSATDAAASEARYFDLAVLPWSSDLRAAQEMTQAVVFGAGRPVIVVPPSPSIARIDHIAIAWDGSRVAARALGDLMPLLSEGTQISVLTVQDEKPLAGSSIAHTLAASLEKRGFAAKPVEIALRGRTIAEALQEAALSEGAQLLAMGAFGHSRIRDFILGGATKGILAQLRLPTLLSH